MPSSPDTVAYEEKRVPSGGRWKDGASPAFRCHLGWAEILAVIVNMQQPRKKGGKGLYLVCPVPGMSQTLLGPRRQGK